MTASDPASGRAAMFEENTVHAGLAEQRHDRDQPRPLGKLPRLFFTWTHTNRSSTTTKARSFETMAEFSNGHECNPHLPRWPCFSSEQ